MKLWVALALAAAAKAAGDTTYEIDKLQALVDNKKTLFDTLEATLHRATQEEAPEPVDDKKEKKKKKKKDSAADADAAAPAKD